MIIIRLIGGLGNQLFQYAYARSLAIKNNVDFKFDLTLYDKNLTSRIFLLEKFNVIENLRADEKTILKLKFKSPPLHIKFKYFLRKKSINAKYYKTFSKNYIEETEFSFNEEKLKAKDNTYHYGFWQSEKFFIEIKNIIKEEFEFITSPDIKNQQFLDKINNVNAVSLHVRRTDYLDHDAFCGICDLKYYEKAIKYISERVENPIYFIFSDDIEWSKQNIKIDFETVFVDINDEKNCFEDLRLMKSCKHNIIANSSFSWWGAWLNDYHDKIVVSPNKWTKTNSINDIICDNWIRI